MLFIYCSELKGRKLTSRRLNDDAGQSDRIEFSRKGGGYIGGLFQREWASGIAGSGADGKRRLSS